METMSMNGGECRRSFWISTPILLLVFLGIFCRLLRFSILLFLPLLTVFHYPGVRHLYSSFLFYACFFFHLFSSLALFILAFCFLLDAKSGFADAEFV